MEKAHVPIKMVIWLNIRSEPITTHSLFLSSTDIMVILTLSRTSRLPTWSSWPPIRPLRTPKIYSTNFTKIGPSKRCCSLDAVMLEVSSAGSPSTTQSGPMIAMASRETTKWLPGHPLVSWDPWRSSGVLMKAFTSKWSKAVKSVFHWLKIWPKRLKVFWSRKEPIETNYWKF